MDFSLLKRAIDAMGFVVINIIALPLIMSIYLVGIFGFILNFKIGGYDVSGLYSIIGGWIVIMVLNIQLIIASFVLGPILAFLQSASKKTYASAGILYSLACSFYYFHLMEMNAITAVSGFFSGVTTFYLWYLFTKR